MGTRVNVEDLQRRFAQITTTVKTAEQIADVAAFLLLLLLLALPPFLRCRKKESTSAENWKVNNKAEG